jgi:fructose-bisphosphate aldolase/6-deoxy-5-ketofructose 1-phosphate synthase
MLKINIPLTVPPEHKAKYYKNFKLATKKTGKLMLFAGDQKIEHLNDDFYGKNAHSDDASPEHLFKIAKKAKIGVFAAQLGLIANYGKDYKTIPYLIKLNSKTNLIDTIQKDPQSKALNSVKQVVELQKETRLKIVGVGYTIYLGSEYEAEMLAEAAQIVHNAHRQGLIAVLWMYPRGKAVNNEKDSHLIAGATGTASSLGADFVKVIYPAKADKRKVQEIIKAAGRTGVIFSGGSSVTPKIFLKKLSQQINYGARGSATGRNIHQQSLEKAVRMANAITAISINNKTAIEAYQIYTGK